MQNGCVKSRDIIFSKLSHGTHVSYLHTHATFANIVSSFYHELQINQFPLYLFLYICSGYATGSSILPFHLVPSFAHSISGFHASLSQRLLSLSLFPTLPSFLSLSSPAMSVSLYPSFLYVPVRQPFFFAWQKFGNAVYTAHACTHAHTKGIRKHWYLDIAW